MAVRISQNVMTVLRTVDAVAQAMEQPWPDQIEVVENASPMATSYEVFGYTLSVPEVLVENLPEEHLDAIISHEMQHQEDADAMQMVNVTVQETLIPMVMKAQDLLKEGREKEARTILRDARFLAIHLIAINNEAEVRASTNAAELCGFDAMKGAYANIFRLAYPKMAGFDDDEIIHLVSMETLEVKRSIPPYYRAEFYDMPFFQILHRVAERLPPDDICL